MSSVASEPYRYPGGRAGAVRASFSASAPTPASQGRVSRWGPRSERELTQTAGAQGQAWPPLSQRAFKPHLLPFQASTLALTPYSGATLLCPVLAQLSHASQPSGRSLLALWSHLHLPGPRAWPGRHSWGGGHSLSDWLSWSWVGCMGWGLQAPLSCCWSRAGLSWAQASGVTPACSDSPYTAITSPALRHICERDRTGGQGPEQTPGPHLSPGLGCTGCSPCPTRWSCCWGWQGARGQAGWLPFPDDPARCGHHGAHSLRPRPGAASGLPALAERAESQSLCGSQTCPPLGHGGGRGGGPCSASPASVMLGVSPLCSRNTKSTKY